MDIRQLRYFLAVLDEGSVGAAAGRHFVTQPAVSAQLRRLETEVGEPLFIREGRRMIPTEAARVLARQAQAVVAQMDALEATMGGLRGLETGTLRVGNIDAASVYVLPEVYREFHERYPGVSIEITVGDTRELLDALRRGDVELATTTLPVEAPSFVVREIYREKLIAVAPPEDPLSKKRRVTLADIADAGVIAYPAGSTTRRIIERVFNESGARLRARMEISSPEAIKRLAQAGLGAAILPEPVVQEELAAGSLAALRCSARFDRALGMVYRSDDALSPAAREFLRMVVAHGGAGALT